MGSQDLDNARLERMFRLSTNIIVGLTTPMKRAIQAVAASRHISMSDLVREALVAHMKAVYPEYETLYHQYMQEGAERILKGDTNG